MSLSSTYCCIPSTSFVLVKTRARLPCSICTRNESCMQTASENSWISVYKMTLEKPTDAMASSAQSTPISRFEPLVMLARFTHTAWQKRACLGALCSQKSSKMLCLPSSTTTLLHSRWKHTARICRAASQSQLASNSRSIVSNTRASLYCLRANACSGLRMHGCVSGVYMYGICAIKRSNTPA